MFTKLFLMNLLPTFNRRPVQERKERVSPNVILNSTTLPSPDFATLATKNEFIPDEVKRENWGSDLVGASLNNFTEKDRTRIERMKRIRTMTKGIYTPTLPIWWFGVNIEQQNKELDYDLAYSVATYRSVRDKTDGRNLLTQLTSGHQIVETKDTSAEPQQQKGKILGVL